MSISIDCCEVQRRVTLSVTATAIGATPITDRVEAAVADRPALAGWDWIVDLRTHVPPPPWDIPRLVEFMDSPEFQSHTVIVTGDPAVEAWVRILNSQFRARRHWVASTPLTAAALLDSKSASGGYCRLQG